MLRRRLNHTSGDSDAGHLLWTLTGQHGNPHFGVLHILSNVLIFAGFILLSSAWNVLYRAQRNQQLATTGVYAQLRHPQYVGFIAEEREALKEFGREYEHYAALTPPLDSAWVRTS